MITTTPARLVACVKYSPHLPLRLRQLGSGRTQGNAKAFWTPVNLKAGCQRITQGGEARAVAAIDTTSPPSEAGTPFRQPAPQAMPIASDKPHRHCILRRRQASYRAGFWGRPSHETNGPPPHPAEILSLEAVPFEGGAGHLVITVNESGSGTCRLVLG